LSAQPPKRLFFPFFTAITVSMVTSDDIAQIIRYYRKQTGLSQLALAQIAGVGKTVVFDIEKGKPTIQLDTLLKVLDVLNIQLRFKVPFI
jgi:HTH-type transcriptional regulator/antitoxin HipB